MSRSLMLTLVVSLVAACGGSSEGPSDFSGELDAAVPVDLADVSDFAGTDLGPAGPDLACVGTDDCYSCPASTDPQFLNHCTDSTCSAFDNQARLPLLLPNGGLPPLQ